jgi:hypothetical protein
VEEHLHMMRYKLFAISIAVLLTARGVSQEKPPNFSGTWRINFQKSHPSGPLPEDERVKIEQNGSDLNMILIVRTKGVDDLMRFHYVIGSSDNQNELHGGSMKSSSHWEGGTLKVDSVVMYGKDPLKLADLWFLSADGQTLTFQEHHQYKDEPAGDELFDYDKQPDGSWEPPSASQPAEEVYKNIQALRGVPASQLPLVMTSFTVSLGVDCTHCHVANEFPKDDKPAKVMARRMLKMVQEINEKNFSSGQRVSCWTCHRGNVKPESSPK